MNKTKARKVNWNDPNWNGATTGNDANYDNSDILDIEAQSPNTAGSKRTFRKGVYFRSDNLLAETAVFVVSLSGTAPMLTGNSEVAKPCPPMCGNDGPDFEPANSLLELK